MSIVGFRARALVALGVIVLCFNSSVAATQVTADEARNIAREAYIFGASYVDNYRIYLKAPVDAEHPLPVKFNELLQLHELIGPEVGDTPNNETLFSYTILDLRREPIVVSVPEVSADRLYMMQLGDASTETLPYISSIAHWRGFLCLLLVDSFPLYCTPPLDPEVWIRV